MTLRFATPDELPSWNDRVLANPDSGNILQSQEMSAQKELSGWKPRYLLSDSLALVALEKNIPVLGKLWYVIKGPGVATTDELKAALPDLRRLAKEGGVFAIKIEPEIIKSDTALAELKDAGLVKVKPVQPNTSTIFLDITDDLDTLIARLDQKTRHAIRRAGRDGVRIELVEASDENCQKMYQLYQTTASGLFAIRPYAYYKKFWQRFAEAGMGQMFFAYADDKLLASAYALKFGNKSTYKDGASLRDRPVYGTSHLLQWRVIEWAQSEGATIHDFCGSPPSDQIKNPDHPYFGFGRFKLGFNKEVTDFVGAYDIVIRPFHYKIWAKIGERLARRWHFSRHHENFY